MAVKKIKCYIKGVEQKYPNVPPGTPIYARAVVVDNLVFVSGMTAQSFETGVCEGITAEEQTRTCLLKLKAALEDAGSCLENLVKTLVLFRDMRDYQKVRKTELAFYQEFAPDLVEHPIGSTVLQAVLAQPEFLVEIEAIAVINK